MSNGINNLRIVSVDSRGVSVEGRAPEEQTDCDLRHDARGGSAPPRPAPENVTPLATPSLAREPISPAPLVHGAPCAWDFAMAERLYALDDRQCPVPLAAEILTLLSREFPNRRAAKEALALLESAVVP